MHLAHLLHNLTCKKLRIKHVSYRAVLLVLDVFAEEPALLELEGAGLDLPPLGLLREFVGLELVLTLALPLILPLLLIL